MRTLLLAATALGLAAAAVPANATQIIALGQTSGANTITATTNGNAATATQTTIKTNGTGAAVLITQLFGAITPPAIAGFFAMTATSVDAVQGIGPALLQHYSGNFTICSLLGCAGAGNVNELSGTFTDAAFGLATGDQLSVNVSNPPDTLTLTSDVIPAVDLLAPSSFTLSMSNIAGLAAQHTTIAPFTASFSAVADASGVPEPATLGMLGVGLLGLGLVSRRVKRG